MKTKTSKKQSKTTQKIAKPIAKKAQTASKPVSKKTAAPRKTANPATSPKNSAKASAVRDTRSAAKPAQSAKKPTEGDYISMLSPEVAAYLKSTVERKTAGRKLQVSPRTGKPTKQWTCIRCCQQTIDILTDAKAKTGEHAWNAAIDQIVTAVENQKRVPKITVPKLPQGLRFLRIGTTLVDRLAALHLGKTTDDALYIAAARYLA